jgi:hypothetical protein
VSCRKSTDVQAEKSRRDGDADYDDIDDDYDYDGR